MVMIIAIFVYTVTPLNALISAWGVPDGAPKLVLVIVARIVLMPVIAGISYEITVQLGGQPSRQPASEGGAVAGYADAVPHHERARRRHA